MIEDKCWGHVIRLTTVVIPCGQLSDVEAQPEATKEFCGIGVLYLLL